MVGGGVFRLLPDLAWELGADGWARDLRDAVLLARRLAARRSVGFGGTNAGP
jgi:hypothetical protein